VNATEEQAARPDAAVSGALVEAMRDPSFYPDRPTQVDLAETHISLVFLAGDRAYKIRKPVTFPFLDYGSLQRRKQMSEEEVRLGRRLADGIYRGVKAVVASPDGTLRLTDADADDALEYVVEMERFDPTRTLAALLERGELEAETMRELAARVSGFHANADRVSTGASTITTIAESVDDNFATLLPYADVVGPRALEAGHHHAIAFLHRCRPLLLRRAEEGWIRDGHGDLRLEQVVLRDGVQIPDPVEFDPTLRQIDVAADLAFLIMDLHDKGADRLAQILIGEAATSGVDYGGRRLLYFYAAYRAWVRVKVACLRADGPGASGEDDREEARRLARLGARLSWKSIGPLTVVICGRSGSGKSTLAARLADLTALPIVRSDVIRKELLGLAADQPAGDDGYSDEVTVATYRRLGEAAAAGARHGDGTIVDATFIRHDFRDAFRDAYGDGPEPLFIQCTAPESTLLKRSAARASSGGDPSDAGPEIVRLQATMLEPLDEVDASRHLILRTSGDEEAALALVEGWLGRAVSV
jgi:aminoglycoside phosphotransferase family enzyme/predicted kinase